MTLEFLEPAFGLCVVVHDYDVLKMPESPGEVLEALALVKMTSDLRAGQDVHPPPTARLSPSGEASIHPRT